MHFWLRPIEIGQLGLRNLKYFSWKFQHCPSFFIFLHIDIQRLGHQTIWALHFGLLERDELNPLECCKYLTQVTSAQIFAKQYLHFSNLNFTMKLFFSAWSIFSSYKRSAPNGTDFNLVCTFAVILDRFSALTSSNLFSVENMVHNQLKKCSNFLNF